MVTTRMKETGKEPTACIAFRLRQENLAHTDICRLAVIAKGRSLGFKFRTTLGTQNTRKRHHVIYRIFKYNPD